MNVIFALTVRRTWKRIVVLATGFLLFELVVGLSYSSADRDLLRKLIDGLPPAFRALVSASGADITSPSGYLGSGYFHPVALTLQAAAVISLAAGAARDVEDGVAEMILSRPLDRWRWLGAQGCWVLIASGLVAAGGTIGGFLATRSLAALSDVHISSLVIVGAGGWLLTATIGMFALLIASAVRTGARVVGLVAGATLVAYAVNYLSVIWGVIRPFGRLSPFHYYDPTRILGNGSMPWSSVATLLAAALVLGLAALISVQRREFSP